MRRRGGGVSGGAAAVSGHFAGFGRASAGGRDCGHRGRRAGERAQWLSGSAVSVSGPAAGLTVVVLSAISTLGSWPTVLAATAVAGVIQMGLGLARAGIIALYFPAVVIRGMLAAIGIILIMKQLPHFFGADADYFEDMNFL